MADKPLLILSEPGAPSDRDPGRRFPFTLHRPSRSKQVTKFKPFFISLLKTFAKLRFDSGGVLPEEVLVLETKGPVEKFINATKRIDGLEWLGEIETDEIEPDEDFYYLNNPKKGEGEPVKQEDMKLRKRIFMVFSNQSGLRRLLGLWNKWKREKRLSFGLAPFNALFNLLSDIRRWDVRDRLQDTGMLEGWNDWLSNEQQSIPFQIELWFRSKPETRAASKDTVLTLVRGLQGELVTESIISEISYHGLLVKIPRASVERIVNELNNSELLKCSSIQYFRPTGQMVLSIGDNAEHLSDAINSSITEPLTDPIIALLDSMPLQNHNILRERLRVDDPDNFESIYSIGERDHGTAMSSLILKGDLSINNDYLKSFLYVRPIMVPDTRDWHAIKVVTIPHDILEVDLIHRSVVRLFDGDGNSSGVAPNVCIVNLSIGIYGRTFEYAMTPLAKLIDWLSWKYKVLFTVSAGNHTTNLSIGIRESEIRSKTPSEIQRSVLRALMNDTRNRGILSPAESINSLTVGAQHRDLSTEENLNARVINPFSHHELPNVISAHGHGYKRSVKPDVLLPGGKQMLNIPNLPTDDSYEITKRIISPGQKVATPGTVQGALDKTKYSCGTSNSTALTTRLAGELHETLIQLRNEHNGSQLDQVPKAVLLKALIAHGASWNAAKELFEDAFDDDRYSIKSMISRLLGYGFVDTAFSKECYQNKVTTIGVGVINVDQSFIHNIPLPEEINGVVCKKRLVVTLAWLSPINSLHQKYRKAKLIASLDKDPLHLTSKEVTQSMSQKGTLQHEIFENHQRVAYPVDSSLEIKVNCFEDSPSLDESIPYALITTLQVAEPIDIYSEIRNRILIPRIRV